MERRTVCLFEWWDLRKKFSLLLAAKWDNHHNFHKHFAYNIHACYEWQCLCEQQGSSLRPIQLWLGGQGLRVSMARWTLRLQQRRHIFQEQQKVLAGQFLPNTCTTSWPGSKAFNWKYCNYSCSHSSGRTGRRTDRALDWVMVKDHETCFDSTRTRMCYLGMKDS